MALSAAASKDSSLVCRGSKKKDKKCLLIQEGHFCHNQSLSMYITSQYEKQLFWHINAIRLERPHGWCILPRHFAMAVISIQSPDESSPTPLVSSHYSDEGFTYKGQMSAMLAGAALFHWSLTETVFTEQRKMMKSRILIMAVCHTNNLSSETKKSSTSTSTSTSLDRFFKPWGVCTVQHVAEQH